MLHRRPLSVPELLLAGALLAHVVTGAATAQSLADGVSHEELDTQRFQPTEWVRDLGAPSFRTRERAMQALLREDLQHIPVLLSALQSEDREVRRRSMVVLRQYCQSADAQLRRETLRATRALATHNDPQLAAIGNTVLRQHRRIAIQRLRAKGGRIKLNPDGSAAAVNLSQVEVQLEDLELLGCLTEVQEVDLRFTPTTDEGLGQLKFLTKLTKLNLQQTHISDNSMPLIASFAGLESLSLEKTAVTDTGLQHIGRLEKLQTLYLGGSKVRGPGLLHLKNLQHLRYLSFQHSPLNDKGVEFATQLPFLTTLGLDDTKVTEDCLDDLIRHGKLEHLWLTNAPINDGSVEKLAEMKQLKSLHIAGTKLTPLGLYQLSQKLPQTKIRPTPPKK